MILLDTHVIIWLLGDPGRISPSATHAILQSEAERSGLGISSVSLYEVVRGIIRGRMRVDLPLGSFLEALESRFVVFQLSKEAAKSGAALPDSFPGDPCDRFIAGTAMALNVPLVTMDSRIRAFSAVKTIW
jgi:PIN domain nuclease of toxin-antitoxin system